MCMTVYVAQDKVILQGVYNLRFNKGKQQREGQRNEVRVKGKNMQLRYIYMLVESERVESLKGAGGHPEMVECGGGQRSMVTALTLDAILKFVNWSHLRVT